MNGLDFVILAVLGIGALYGLSRGALRMLTSVVSLTAALYFASIYYTEAGSIAHHQLSVSPTVGDVVGYITVFALVFIAIESVGAMVNRILHTIHLRWMDRLAGGAVGLAIAAALMGLGLMLMTALLPADAALLRASQMAPQVLGYTQALAGYVPEELKQAYDRKRAELYRYWLERAMPPGLKPSPTPTR